VVTPQTKLGLAVESALANNHGIMKVNKSGDIYIYNLGEFPSVFQKKFGAPKSKSKIIHNRILQINRDDPAYLDHINMLCDYLRSQNSEKKGALIVQAQSIAIHEHKQYHDNIEQQANELQTKRSRQTAKEFHTDNRKID